MYWRCCLPDDYTFAADVKKAFDAERERIAYRNLNKIQEYFLIVDHPAFERDDSEINVVSLDGVHQGLLFWVLGLPLSAWPISTTYSGRPECSVNYGPNEDPDTTSDAAQYISLHITDPAINGEVVEVLLSQEAEQVYPYLQRQNPDNWWSTHVGFSFVEAEHDSSMFLTEPLPSVVVVSKVPLPEPGTISMLFDRVVIDQKKWHLRLGGQVSKQTPLVALRTWAIGLLVNAGASVNDATILVADRGGIAWVTPPRFNQDRDMLLRRVPRAKPFLMQRPRKHKGETAGQP
jgi:hypothetical protein